MPGPIRKQINRRYKDLDLDMHVHPHTDDLIVNVDDTAINGSLMHIIKTRKGEREFNNTFGSTIYNVLFEPMHWSVTVELRTHIENTINSQEPRINLRSVDVVELTQSNGYEISITYTPINETRIVELEFFLERLR